MRPFYKPANLNHSNNGSSFEAGIGIHSASKCEGIKGKSGQILWKNPFNLGQRVSLQTSVRKEKIGKGPRMSQGQGRQDRSQQQASKHLKTLSSASSFAEVAAASLNLGSFCGNLNTDSKKKLGKNFFR